jgi:hypothetical protein
MAHWKAAAVIQPFQVLPEMDRARLHAQRLRRGALSAQVGRHHRWTPLTQTIPRRQTKAIPAVSSHSYRSDGCLWEIHTPQGRAHCQEIPTLALNSAFAMWEHTPSISSRQLDEATQDWIRNV